jgi:DNA-binding NarL/FixJ family response regulator
MAALIRPRSATTYGLDEYVYEALLPGASGFLLKDVPPERLVDAVKVIASGDALLNPSITRAVIEPFVRRAPAEPGPGTELEHLTERELEVLRLLTRGQSTPRSRGRSSSATRRSRRTSYTC